MSELEAYMELQSEAEIHGMAVAGIDAEEIALMDGPYIIQTFGRCRDALAALKAAIGPAYTTYHPKMQAAFDEIAKENQQAA